MRRFTSHPSGRLTARFPASCHRLGFTLVEMLVVISIMVILVTVTATAIVPATSSRRSREAARSLNVYLSSARNRAMETGRPCGVILHRLSSTSACSLSIDQCEVPPNYSGDLETSYAEVTTASGSATAKLSDGTPSLVHVGDVVQFNYQGPYFSITSATSHDADTLVVTTDTLTLSYDTSQGQLVPSWSARKLPYRIFRTPVKGAASPLQLPAGTVVDLGASGTDTTPSWGAVNITILFSPNGSVQTVYTGTTAYTVLEPIYLMIGKRERVGNSFVSSPSSANRTSWPNYQDLDNVWLTINPQSGLVATSPVAAITIGSVSTAADAIRAARSLASDAQGMGGR
ncbi:MAG: prepilin-type N-terminal cleavage/methylation domain-containing protein [Thermoguttaceae bacterium]